VEEFKKKNDIKEENNEQMNISLFSASPAITQYIDD